MFSMKVSVIICTHNPRTEYLRRVLVALEGQTLPKSEWELLLIDNASNEALTNRVKVAWHPAGRIVREEEIGLSAARIRGFTESQGEILILVDDDNVLNSDYLEQSLRIAREWPQLGVWGGSIVPEFEVAPAEHLRPYLKDLALREVKQARWGNVWHCQDAEPRGAGLCIRKEGAVAYCNQYDSSVICISDRKGNALVSGGDTELAYVVCSLGLGMGVFPELQLVHLIPKQRLEDDYIVRLNEGLNFSSMLLFFKWGGVTPKSPLSTVGLARLLRNTVLRRGIERRLWFAGFRATIAARRIIKASQMSAGPPLAGNAKGRRTEKRPTSSSGEQEQVK
jgi:glycosyltransferase involved in cell wall biosynthesis